MEKLTVLGASLKDVGIPDPSQSATLAEFSQKLNRLIGGTTSVGFDAFAPLSRKTALLAEKCANIKEMTIRLLIVNLNKVVALLSSAFSLQPGHLFIDSRIHSALRNPDIAM